MEIRPVEALLLGYFGLMALISAFFHERVPEGATPPLAYAPAALFLLAMAYAGQRLPDRRAVSFARFAAPLLVLPFAYGAAGSLSRVLHGRFLDDDLRAWELGLFGVSPNAAANTFAVPPLTELLTLCYFSYYGCFLLPVILYARGRGPLAERYLFTTMTGLLICYLGFISLPVVGPASGPFAGHRPDGYLITALQNHIMVTFDPPGACFPSPHVAGAWITVLCLRRHVSRKAARLLTALATGLTVAVVYDWYHYLVDVAGGLLVALAVHAVTERWAARRARTARTARLARTALPARPRTLV
ncbi:phosphatase PAP2 family protein [Nonomuraea candida]|uniref:phosphatase PAP2 family protein n=1 Tax=Nonomuraea candida TaxID=359159 RepID=UPI0012FB6574|nr:phosphatase PAP2 family protein [Nonomuraea candida]